MHGSNTVTHAILIPSSRGRIGGNNPMNAEADNPKSDWPLNFLLDEVWLKSRRVLVHQLEASKLWLKTENYEQYMKGQKELGDKIKREILRDILGQQDYAYLNSEVIFGPANRRFMQRLPYITAFGYELGSLMSLLLDGEETNAHEVSVIASIFNVGISMFDYIFDTSPKLFNELNLATNEKALCSMIIDKDRCRKLLDECEAISAPEARLLSKLVISFFDRLHLLYSESGRKNAWKNVTSSILSSYRSEIKSSACNRSSFKDAYVIGREKSTLPFQVIFHIAQLSPFTIPEDSCGDLTAYIDNLGELFWLLDDLMDVIPDLQSKHLNSIILEIREKLQETKTSSPIYEILVKLLNGNYIESQTDKICFRIEKILDPPMISRYSGKIPKTIHEFIASYVRSWMI